MNDVQWAVWCVQEIHFFSGRSELMQNDIRGNFLIWKSSQQSTWISKSEMVFHSFSPSETDENSHSKKNQFTFSYTRSGIILCRTKEYAKTNVCTLCVAADHDLSLQHSSKKCNWHEWREGNWSDRQYVYGIILNFVPHRVRRIQKQSSVCWWRVSFPTEQTIRCKTSFSSTSITKSQEQRTSCKQATSQKTFLLPASHVQTS